MPVVLLVQTELDHEEFYERPAVNDRSDSAAFSQSNQFSATG